MSKKRVFAIIILVFGVILISLGVYFLVNNGFNNNGDSENNSNNNTELNGGSNDEVPEIVINYDDAYATAESLYGGEDKTVEVKEEETKFIIYVKNSKGILLNTFNMDKKTGLISEVAQEFTDELTSN